MLTDKKAPGPAQEIAASSVVCIIAKGAKGATGAKGVGEEPGGRWVAVTHLVHQCIITILVSPPSSSSPSSSSSAFFFSHTQVRVGVGASPILLAAAAVVGADGD